MKHFVFVCFRKDDDELEIRDPVRSRNDARSRKGARCRGGAPRYALAACARQECIVFDLIYGLFATVLG